MNPYEAKIRQLASDLLEEHMVLCDCDCYNLPRSCLQFDPQNYKTFKEAAYAYSEGRLLGKMYWSVHLNGRHVLHIHHAVFGGTDNMSCPVCRELRSEQP